MNVLKYLKKINNLKKINANAISNITINQKYFLKKLYIDHKSIYYIFFKKYIINTIKFGTTNSDYYINLLKNCIDNCYDISKYTASFYKNIAISKYYSSYDLNSIYGLATKLNLKKIRDKFMYSNNKFLNIRYEFKYKNVRVIKRIAMLDIILRKYLEGYTNNKISLNFDKYNIVFFKYKDIFVRAIRRKLRRIRRMLKWAKVSLRNFVRVSLIFLCTKDIDIFIKILIRIMNSMHFKNHRKFLYYLKLFIAKALKYYFNILKFSGFFFNLSGKISGGGNSKKKRYAIRCGKYSLTNKTLKVKYRKGLIHTKTGVLGFKFMISYN